MTRKPTAVLLDYGATVDTPGIHWYDMFLNAYHRYCPTAADEQIRQAYIGVERLLERNDIVDENDDFSVLLHKKINHHLRLLNLPAARYGAQIHDCLYRQVAATIEQNRPVLQYLHGKYTTAVVSNFYGNLPTVLQSFRLSAYVDHCIDSGTAGIRKPSAAIYSHALSLLGLSPQKVIMVGDSEKNDIKPARALGMMTAHLQPSATASLSLPHAVINSLQQLTRLL